MSKKFPRPTHDRILILQDASETKSKGGIIIPDHLIDKDRPGRGVVKAVGLGRYSESGQRIPVEVKPGDVVLFSKHAGTPVEYEGETYLVMRDADTFCAI